MKFGWENVSDNLMFDSKHPMRNGKFLSTHPFIDCKEPLTFANNPHPDATDRLNKFRQAGYFASCFPEGDGITIQRLKGQSEQQLIEDVCKILEISFTAIKEA